MPHLTRPCALHNLSVKLIIVNGDCRDPCAYDEAFVVHVGVAPEVPVVLEVTGAPAIPTGMNHRGAPGNHHAVKNPIPVPEHTAGPSPFTGDDLAVAVSDSYRIPKPLIPHSSPSRVKTPIPSSIC